MQTSLIEPVLRDKALLESIADANVSDGNFRLWWLGQSGFLLQWNGCHLLLDPYLSDSLTKKYASTATPHIRMTAVPVEPLWLCFIDVVTASHIHTDHLDPATLLPLFERNPNLKFVIPEAERSAIQKKLGIEWPATFGLDNGSRIVVDGFRIHGVASAHESIEVDQNGRSRFLGYVIEFGDWTIYHSGDTVLYPTIVENLKSFRIDLAFLPINGRAPERKVAGNLNAKEAAWLGREIGALAVIPCHYDMFTFNTAPVDEFRAAAREIDLNYHVVRCGEKWESSHLRHLKEASLAP